MTPPPDDTADDLRAYLDGDPEAVRAAGPDEPNAAQWDAVCRRIHARVSASKAAEPARGPVRFALVAACGALMAATAAALAWVLLTPPRTVLQPEVVRAKPVAPAVPPAVDPLAEFAVLPIASPDEVEVTRVPGSGVLPVGADPLPEVLVLATTDEVELDDPNPTWPQVSPAPGDAPMIFAAKPR